MFFYHLHFADRRRVGRTNFERKTQSSRPQRNRNLNPAPFWYYTVLSILIVNVFYRNIVCFSLVVLSFTNAGNLNAVHVERVPEFQDHGECHISAVSSNQSNEVMTSSGKERLRVLAPLKEDIKSDYLTVIAKQKQTKLLLSLIHTSTCYINAELKPVGIFHHVMFNLNYFFSLSLKSPRRGEGD